MAMEEIPAYEGYEVREAYEALPEHEELPESPAAPVLIDSPVTRAGDEGTGADYLPPPLDG